MTSLANCEADGVPSSGVDFRALRRFLRAPREEVLAGLQLTAAAALALGLALTPAAAHKPPAAAPASFVPATITAEALAGPAVADTVDSKHMLQDLMTKAGLRPSFGLRHLSWDQARRLNALMPDAKMALDAAKPFILPVDTKNGQEALRCLTQAAYYEAGANGPDAKAAVVQVVLNRVRHPDFPKSVCGVVYQGSERGSGCQFTFTCDGALARPVDKAAWDEARKVAARALSGYVVRTVGTSTYYHADYVFPAWAPNLQKMATVGPHIFYRMTGEEGSSSFLTGRYAGGELKLAKIMLRAEKPARVDPSHLVQVHLGDVPSNDVPAGLRVQADRMQRIHAVIAVAAKTPEPTPVQTVAPTPIQPPAPAVQTAEASSPAA